ncbi:MAG: trypco2 family protein [Nostoc sp. ChiQUE02]|uniref:trypco2 family protein n=1 Tax=Nostoc sp. ChiQUE02 TaxID=3075377 RepID=UPI002AD31C5B|nr:trypco2 family protein [Nostoc sp. ChiQUE02]MDZ8229262.1 trypco2 family protein [Nostoc sp. ChiQUE02]
MSNKISLNEFIAQVKEDLKPTEDTPIFFLEKAELEINVAVSKEGSLEGEVKGTSDLKISVLGVDFFKMGELQASGKASGKLERKDIHTIKVTLVPIFSNEEIKSSLTEDQLVEIKRGIKRKIMRGEQEDSNSNFSETELEESNKATKNKKTRG